MWGILQRSEESGNEKLVTMKRDGWTMQPTAWRGLETHVRTASTKNWSIKSNQIKNCSKSRWVAGGKYNIKGSEAKRGFSVRFWSYLETAEVMSGIRPEAEEIGPVWVRSSRRVDERQVQRRDDWRAHTSVRRGSRASGYYAGHECEDPETEPDGVLLQDCHTGASTGSRRQETVVLE